MAGTPLTAHARTRPAGTTQLRLLVVALLGTALLGAVTVVPTRVDAAAPAAPRPAEVAAAADDPTVIAAISDFGYAHPTAVTYADMVKGWDPEYIITTGDNVQTADIPGDGAAQYAYAVGRLYCGYLKGAATGLGHCDSGGTSSTNRFFPAAGNHDHDDGPLAGYLSYFDLPGPGATSNSPSGSELWYDVVLGDVHVFVIDSDTVWAETSLPVGDRTQTNAMKAWLEDAVEDSPAAWQVVTVHEPPFGSSNDYGSTPYLQWDYASWGVDLVLNGHAAVYERVQRDGINYITNGLGGGEPTGFGTPISGSIKRVGNPAVPAEDVMGGLLMTATPTRLDVEWKTSGAQSDSFALTQAGPPEITTTSLSAGTQNSDYDRTLAATGGTEPYTWTRTAGSLPTGLSLSSSGTISGKPTVTGTSNFTVRVTDADGATDTQALSLTINAAAASGGLFTGLTPTRLLDTRRPGEAPCVSGAGGRQLTVTGVAGIPADASAVALNAAVVGPSSPGYLKVHPTGSAPAEGANVNYVAGQTVPNMVTVKVGIDGKITLFASGGCPHLVVDVAGYYSDGPTAPGGFVGFTSSRLLDTRRSEQGPCVRGSSGRELTVAPSSAAGIPASASAVALNVAVTDASAPGYLSVSPTGSAIPTASNLNFVARRAVSNHVSVKVGSGGKITLFASGGCPHVVVDVLGYFAAGPAASGGFEGIAPGRVYDSRSPGRTCLSGRVSVRVAPFGSVPTGASAVALNVAAVKPTASGFLSVYPSDASPPTASNVNYVKGDVVPNAVLVKVGSDGRVNVRASGGCPDVVIDVVGYHAG